MNHIAIKVSPVAFFLLIICCIFQSYGQSQSQMNQTAYENYRKADKELGVVYQKIIKEYAAQPVFIKNLRAAERLWIQLKDAELAARFPEEAGSASGTVGPMCRAAFLESLTRERIKFLKVWLDGIPEGDVCSGSVKSK